jgi:hypothetical protein
VTVRRKFNASYVVIPLVYVVLIFALILLQFSGGKLFNVTIGPISLNGSFAMGGGTEKKQLAGLTVQVQGIRFLFDKDHVVRLQNQDESFTDLALTGYTTTKQGFSLQFTHGVALGFQFVESDANAVTVMVDMPQSMLPLVSIRIPYEGVSDATLTTSRSQPNVEIAWRGNSYIAQMPTRSFADEQYKLLVLPGEGTRTIRIAQKATSPKNIIEDFQVPAITQKEYDEAVDSFVTSAYNGWKTSRFSSTNGTWSYRDSDNRFNEETMIALLAEAWQRDEYTRVYNEMRTTADQHPTKMTWKSSVFMGNLRRVTSELAGLDKAESARLNALIAQKDHAVYQTPNLFRFALDRGSSDLAANLIQMTESLATEGMDPVTALGLLQNHYLTDLPDPNLVTMLSRFDGLIKSVLMPAIIHVDEGFFFQAKPNKGDGYYTVLAGRILERAGERNGDSRLIALGRNMVVSVLKLADELGFVPNQIDFSAGAIAAQLKYRAPEDFYWLVHSNPAYPREVSLYSQLGPGHWFYTIATINSIDITPNRYTFSISYPKSRLHFLFFRGLNEIDPSSGMKLFGITWRNDRDFEIYNHGRYYNPDTKTLMVKYTDDTVQRDIIINY